MLPARRAGKMLNLKMELKNKMSSEIEEIQRLKAENDHLKAVCHYKQDYLTESREDLLKLELSDAKREICRLNDAINPHSAPMKKDSKDWYYFTGKILKQDKEIQWMKRTLEQYEKDARDDLTNIQRLKYETLQQRDKTLELSKKNMELERELGMYKAFFTGNEVNVFLKDKEVSVDEVIKGSE